jgi:hypothetical protein
LVKLHTELQASETGRRNHILKVFPRGKETENQKCGLIRGDFHRNGGGCWIYFFERVVTILINRI